MSNRSLRSKRKVKLELPATPVVVQARNDDDKADGRDKPLTDLEIGIEFQLNLRPEDLIIMKELGAGNGGTVSKVKHATTQTIMAKKILHIEGHERVRKQICRELQILQHCNSKYIVSFYGAEPEGDMNVSLYMEYMDVGSLDSIYKKNGSIPLPILGKITQAILEGLSYLYKHHKIIHRDVKPSNILVNSKGQIKLCDFGVSGEANINSYANTFVGTSHYMSPERILGAKYTVQSDIWSVGITLIELALGKFPFPPDSSVLELLQHIVHEPPPRLPAGKFPPDFDDLTSKCLTKDVKDRPKPIELLNHPYLIKAAEEKVDVVEWTRTIKT